MGTTARVVTSALLVVVLGGAGYVVADAHDLVPGFVTLAPPIPDPSPFPTAPGAIEPSAATPALGDLDPAAPMPAAGVVQAQVDLLVQDSRLGPSVGVLVSDELTGEVLATHLPDDGRTPASVAKLATSVATLGRVDGATTLATRVVDGGAADEIVLVGGGDMMLAADHGDPASVVGRAGLGDLADQVAADLALRGTTSVKLRFDDSLFSGPTTSPGWATTDLSYGYVAPVTALAVNIAKTRTDTEYPPRFTDPSANAAKVFAQRLADRGITVTGTPTRVTAAAGARVLGAVRSAPLEEIVGYVLDTSDNTIAEVLTRVLALDEGLPASFSGGTQAVLTELAALGLDTTGAQLADGSGLADGSLLSPRLMVGIVALAMSSDHPKLRDVVLGMPIGGLTGTLSDRFVGSSASGLVRAKTGSLKSVTSLVGTVRTADGRQLLFAVMADQTGAVGQGAPRQAIDGFVTMLTTCGCT
jgi:D-alanyl-D-alanine carboxypeptidase/D-alanyl-D-alanine-endopeptidase (penicillin-binding protein 4)